MKKCYQKSMSYVLFRLIAWTIEGSGHPTWVTWVTDLYCPCISFPQNDCIITKLFRVDLRDLPCKAEPVAEVTPEQTSTSGPGLLSERKSELASLLHSAGKCSASPFLCHTCGTTAAHKLLCLKGKRKEDWNITRNMQSVFQHTPFAPVHFRPLKCPDICVLL